MLKIEIRLLEMHSYFKKWFKIEIRKLKSPSYFKNVMNFEIRLLVNLYISGGNLTSAFNFK